MPNPREDNKESRFEAARDLDLGDGVEITMGVGDRVDWYFTNKASTPDEGPLADIELEISSSEYDNKELLHHLLQETRK